MVWVVLASSMLAFFLYYNTLDAGFVYDDRRAILTNQDVIGDTPIESLFLNDFWGTSISDSGSHGSYRPLCIATFRLNYIISGLKPWSYHLWNVILHTTATALVVIIAKKLLPRSCVKVGSIISGLVFAAHPIHTEAVAAVVGRADLAACNLFLLSFLLYTKHVEIRDIYKSNSVCTTKIIDTKKSIFEKKQNNNNKKRKSCNTKPVKKSSNYISESVCVNECSEFVLWLPLFGCLLLTAAATLCKEPAIMIIPIIIAYDVMRSPPRVIKKMNRWRSWLILGVGGAAILLVRMRIAGIPSKFAAADNPTARDPSFATRILTFAYLPAFNLYLLIYPSQLSFDWSMNAIPRITSLFDPRNILTITFYAILITIALKTLRKEILIFFRKSKKSRTLKFSKMKCKSNDKTTIQRKQQRKMGHDKNRRDFDETLKEANKCDVCSHQLGERHSGKCRTVNNNNYLYQHSCVCIQATFTSQQLSAFIVLKPRGALLTFVAFMALPFLPASNILFYVGFVVAERILYLPSVGFCLLLGLGAGSLTRGWHWHEIRTRIFIFCALLAILSMCGRTLTRNLDWHDEESLFRSAVDINPPKAYGNLGSVLSTKGRNEEAALAFQRALFHRPNMAEVHYNLGILLQNQRRYDAAIKSFEKAIYFRPSMALAYVNMGVSLAAEGKVIKAMSILKAGARLRHVRVRDRREHDSARVSALVQLATLHIQTSNWVKALEAYNEALRIIPESHNHGLSWTRRSVLEKASEIYTDSRHWSHSEQSTLNVLVTSPYDVGVHLSYAKLLARNISRSAEAEHWFNKALYLAPNEPEVRHYFGEFLRSQNRKREAAEQLVLAAQLDSEDAARAANAGMALRDAKLYHISEKWYARATLLSPNDAQGFSNLGAILHVNGKYSEAAASYQRALELQPGDLITFTNLNRVKNLIGKPKK